MKHFTDELWQHIQPIYQNILSHPFIQELCHGDLPRSTFSYYLQQDALYLNDFARALAMTATKADSRTHFLNCLEFAKGAVTAEHSLHQDFFEQFDVVATNEKSLSCLAYTQFLLATATQKSYSESLAALLPCFWIYREVGVYTQSHSVLGNDYQSWIDAYSGDDFNEGVQLAIEMTNEIAQGVSAGSRQKMLTAFAMSAQLELEFWDSAYQFGLACHSEKEVSNAS